MKIYATGTIYASWNALFYLIKTSGLCYLLLRLKYLKENPKLKQPRLRKEYTLGTLRMLNV